MVRFMFSAMGPACVILLTMEIHELNGPEPLDREDDAPVPAAPAPPENRQQRRARERRERKAMKRLAGAA